LFRPLATPIFNSGLNTVLLSYIQRVALGYYLMVIQLEDQTFAILA